MKKVRKKRVETRGAQSHLPPMSQIIPFDPEAGPAYRQMARAIHYLADHYLDQPTLEEAAGAAGISPFHFQRLFSRYVGISPKNFVAHLTLAHAKDQLAKGASVLNAALDAGLSGPSRLHDLSLKIESMTPGEYARGGEGLDIAYGFHDCPFGIALVMATAKGVCGLAFGNEGEEQTMLADMQSRWPRAHYVQDGVRTGAVARQIFEPGHGKPLSLHLLGTPWQIKVWQALLAIPPGNVTTYRAIAESVGDEKAARAVGTSVGRNPLSWIIPCHRVLGSDGALHGYHWGLARKRAMLAVEAARGTDHKPRTSAMA